MLKENFFIIGTVFEREEKKRKNNRGVGKKESTRVSSSGAFLFVRGRLILEKNLRGVGLE